MWYFIHRKLTSVRHNWTPTTAKVNGVNNNGVNSHGVGVDRDNSSKSANSGHSANNGDAGFSGAAVVGGDVMTNADYEEIVDSEIHNVNLKITRPKRSREQYRFRKRSVHVAQVIEYSLDPILRISRDFLYHSWAEIRYCQYGKEKK